MSKAQITIPLDIADVRVLQTSVNERGEIIITIESTKVGTTCSKCGKWITKAHGQDEWVMIRHLPAFGRPSYLRYRPRRYQCLDCEGHPTTTQSLEWHDARSPHSFACDKHILLQVVHATLEDVSMKEGLAYERVAGVLKLLETWWQEITNYFIQRETSAFVEGFNNKVKILKRRCYRIFNIRHLFQRIYLDLHGYRLFAATTISG
jgi:transposase